MNPHCLVVFDLDSVTWVAVVLWQLSLLFESFLLLVSVTTQPFPLSFSLPFLCWWWVCTSGCVRVFSWSWSPDPHYFALSSLPVDKKHPGIRPSIPPARGWAFSTHCRLHWQPIHPTEWIDLPHSTVLSKNLPFPVASGSEGFECTPKKVVMYCVCMELGFCQKCRN